MESLLTIIKTFCLITISYFVIHFITNLIRYIWNGFYHIYCNHLMIDNETIHETINKTFHETIKNRMDTENYPLHEKIDRINDSLKREVFDLKDRVHILEDQMNNLIHNINQFILT